MKSDHPFYEYAVELAQDLFEDKRILRAYSMDRDDSIYSYVMDRKGPQIAMRTLVGLIIAPVVASLEDFLDEMDVAVDYFVDPDSEFGAAPDGHQRTSPTVQFVITADDTVDRVVIYQSYYSKVTLGQIEYAEDFENECKKVFDACLSNLEDTFSLVSLDDDLDEEDSEDTEDETNEEESNEVPESEDETTEDTEDKTNEGKDLTEKPLPEIVSLGDLT